MLISITHITILGCLQRLSRLHRKLQFLGATCALAKTGFSTQLIVAIVSQLWTCVVVIRVTELHDS